MILALDTSTPATIVGLGLGDGTVLERFERRGAQERPGHQEGLLVHAAALLAQAGARWGDVERVGVGIGPGAYTGLRVGVASARALAQSLGVDAVGVSSPMALAHGALALEGSSADRLITVTDARRREVFAAIYAPRTSGASGERVTGDAHGWPPVLEPIVLRAPSVLSRDALRGAFVADMASQQDAPERWLAVGDAANGAEPLLRATLGRALLEVPREDSPLHRIAARALVELAGSASAGALEDVRPEYCRLADAELALQDAGANGRPTAAIAGGIA
ncbi:MAG: tRNA (adenosine(37)-N6)-threonylcarbamoyltransferase complex dimerization subunit type 1 TsaB [Solirubrobacteraceae bacterium]